MRQITPLYDAETIARRIGELGAEIRRDAGSSEVFLLSILKGSSVFLADLLRSIDGDVSYGFVDVVRATADHQLADAVRIDFLSFTDIRDRRVYLLKDVVTTGVIENYLMAQLRLHSPQALRLVALLDRPGVRTVDLACDFKAFQVGDGIFAGYGLEQDRRLANLPSLVRLDA